jgi:wyosine [tRNA(Phe)-imidazoG37] synthetase (radical SAM superfamily)/predicted Fe-Mo cluster-binding NifX family protein
MRVALPTWRERVSPVFDVARVVRIFDIADDRLVDRRELEMDSAGRVETLSRNGVEVLICAAISRPVEATAWLAGIEVISNICGPTDEVIEAFRNGGRDLTAFHSPGSPSETRAGGVPMRFVFGPVPSRRLGRSLGIDPVPSKTCNFSCIYCQLGRTPRPVSKREPFYDLDDITAEIRRAAARHRDEQPDWITFVGSGETTLYARLGELIRFVKAESDLPVAVITNGSLLYRPEVRQELMAADAVLPSLDAGSGRLFRRINRPHPSFSFDQHMEGLLAFRDGYEGNLWVEVMLVKDVNDGAEDLKDIAAAIERIRPEEVHITLPTRPPAEPWVEPAGRAAVRRAASMFEAITRVFSPTELSAVPDLDGDVVEAIHAIVSRHPLRDDELVEMLSHWTPDRVPETLACLSASGKARLVERGGVRFWCAGNAVFAEDEALAHS